MVMFVTDSKTYINKIQQVVKKHTGICITSICSSLIIKITLSLNVFLPFLGTVVLTGISAPTPAVQREISNKLKSHKIGARNARKVQ